jgi:hypothetical protein
MKFLVIIVAVIIIVFTYKLKGALRKERKKEVGETAARKGTIEILGNLEEQLKNNKLNGSSSCDKVLAQSKLSLVIKCCLRSENFDIDLLSKIASINIKNISVDEMKKVTVYLDIKILIKALLAQIKVIKNNTSTDDKKKFSESIKLLLKISKAIDSEKVSLTKLTEYLATIRKIHDDLISKYYAQENAELSKK